MLFTNNFCKQIGPRSGPTKCWAWSVSKLFYTLLVLLKELFKKVDFEKKADNKKHAKLPSIPRQRVNPLYTGNP